MIHFYVLFNVLCLNTLVSCSVTVHRTFTGDKYIGGGCSESICECQRSTRTFASKNQQKVSCLSYKDIADCALGYHEADTQGSIITLSIQKYICAENNPTITDVLVWDMMSIEKGKWKPHWNETLKHKVKLEYSQIKVAQDRNEYWGGLLVKIWITCGGIRQCAIVKFYGKRNYPLRMKDVLRSEDQETTTTTTIITATKKAMAPINNNNKLIPTNTSIIPVLAPKQSGNNSSDQSVLVIVLSSMLAVILILLLLSIIYFTVRRRSKNKGKEEATPQVRQLVNRDNTFEHLYTQNSSTTFQPRKQISDDYDDDKISSINEGIVSLLKVEEERPLTASVGTDSAGDACISTDSVEEHNEVHYASIQRDNRPKPDVRYVL